MFVCQKYPACHCSGARGFKSASAGFSLLEVLVATTVFSLGMAGFTALLLTSITGSTQARREGVAAIAAASLSEYIHLNPVAIDRFMAPPQNLSNICAGETQCTPEQQADYDFRLWQLELADSIHDATGLVCRDGTPQDGIKGNDQCDGIGPLVIKIFWNGQGSTGTGESNQHRYTLGVS